MSATHDSTSADPEQVIADLQRQLAEREADLADALQRETATAEVLGVINSSPGDLAQVFDAMLVRAMRLCGAAYGHLFTYDGESLHPAAVRGDPRYVEHIEQIGSFQPSPNSPLGRIIRGEGVVHVTDLQKDPAFLSVQRYREQAEIGGIRSALIVALRKDHALLGTLSVYRQEVRPFSDKQIALVQNFAAQAVIAMENARLLIETREALEQQTATAAVLQVINSSPGDLTPVFEAILEKAHSLCGAPLGTLVLRDGGQLRAVAMRGHPQEYETLARQGFPPTPAFKLFLNGESFLHVPDGSKPPTGLDDPMRRAAVEISGVRTVLFVPLRKEETVLGYISAQRQEVRAFTDKQIALLQNFAAQAVIAMENARLIAETRETLEQQTATAEVLQVINASPGDLAPVFDAMLVKATGLCDAAFGILWRFDGKSIWPEALHQVPAAFAEFYRVPRQPDPESGPGRMMRGEDAHAFSDIADLPLYAAGDPMTRAIVDLAGAHSSMIAPLRKDGATLGAITIYRQEVRPFTDKQIALLQNFAAQAVIAMENARLLTETREALEQQTATAEVLQVINASPGDLGPVFDIIGAKAIKLCDAACGGIMLPDGDRFRAVALGGVPEAYAEYCRTSLDYGRHTPGSLPLQMLAGAEVVHVRDVADTDGYRGNRPATRALVELGGGRTLLGVALRKDSELLGLITIYRQEVRPFSDRQIGLLRGFAAQAVIAMENARLLGELRQRTDEVAELNRGLEARVAEQVEELGRVGRLKRFLAPQLAEMIVSQGDEKILQSHRREIVVVFCDLRGYTAFAETAEPEEVLDFLREYHGALGPLVSQFEGTLDQFSGDGIMVFFNDPVPIPDPAERAVRMAMAMREEASKLIVTWRRDGCDLGFGVGIAQGYATLGQIGFSERSGYTAIGTVCNLAARLCAEAKDGQILASSRVARAVEAVSKLEDLGNLELKGLHRPVAAFNVVRSTSPAEARPNLTVVARGPGL